MLQLAIAHDFLDLCRQQLLALFFAHFDHLIAENAHVHLGLKFSIATCIISDQSERFYQVFQGVLLLVAACDQ